MGNVSPFDIPWAQEFNGVRKAFIKEFLENVRQGLNLQSALDVGCGVGYLSGFLSGLGFRVVAVDGRAENAQEARRRFPGIEFLRADAEDLLVEELGSFDFVLCAGLLYHLENPFRVIRNLYSLTGKVLLVETMCLPGALPTMELLDEGVSENQGLNYVAFYPSEPCLIKMLYRAGFQFVYCLERLPVDDLYKETLWQKRQRTILVASKVLLEVPNLILARDVRQPVPGPFDPWTTKLSRTWELCKTKMFSMRVSISRVIRPLRKRLEKVRERDVALKPE